MPPHDQMRAHNEEPTDKAETLSASASSLEENGTRYQRWQRTIPLERFESRACRIGFALTTASG